MTLIAYLAGSDEAHVIRLGEIGLTTHADGSVGYGGIVFDDPDKSLTVRGWMEVLVEDDDCPSAPVLYRGWIGNRTISRSSGDTTYKSGGSRFIDCTVVDGNDAAQLRMFVNADAKRPAEGDDDRIAWALSATVGGLDGLIADNGAVNTNPNPFEDADWRGSYATNAIEDMASALGKIFFVYPDPVTGDFGLFYDFPTAGIGTSTLSISNVESDKSSTCFYPLIDASQELDPSEVVSIVRYLYLNGVVLEGNTTTRDDFFSAAATGGVNLGDRGIQLESTRVGSETTARHHAQAYLTEHSIERDTITVAIIVPSSQVGLVRAGQLIHNRFTHLDGHESFVYSRIQTVTLNQWINTKEYVVVLELSNGGLHGSGSGGGGGTGGAPLPPPGTPTQLHAVQSISRDSAGDYLMFPSAGGSWQPVTPGHLLTLGVGAFDAAGAEAIPTPSGWTAVAALTSPSGTGADSHWIERLFYKTAAGGEVIGDFATGFDDQTVVLTEFDGGGTLVTSLAAAGTPAGAHLSNQGNKASLGFGALTTTAGQPVLLVGWGNQTGPTDARVSPWSGTFNETGDEILAWAVCPNIGSAFVINSVASSSGSERISFTMNDNNNFPFWTVAAFLGVTVAADNPPQPLQWVDWTVVTMTTSGGVSVGTTLFPYADRSLQVKVDGVLISPSSYTETDPETGAFALSWLLDPSEVVQVRYQGRP